ncbi:hypothetical protein L1987_79880 [Smallanthus sonchifolius]|uniref:Uncharacterized protein n=1 Tax=Smallanthus sonchifolius TaxID=185202 RepID=A0ACB8YL24_9ASTR|nr:hypothetical protein L1987_79880 [Smallanthus sonchifolius]
MPRILSHGLSRSDMATFSLASCVVADVGRPRPAPDRTDKMLVGRLLFSWFPGPEPTKLNLGKLEPRPVLYLHRHHHFQHA